MPLESGLYLSSLVATNPTSGDPKSQGDDHLRLIKAVLQQTFNNFPGTILVLGTDVGTVNNYVITPTLAVPAYTQGMTVIFGPAATNTGAVTLAVSGLGPVPVAHASGAAVAAGDLPAGRMVGMRYDGTTFQIIDGAGFLSKGGDQKLTGALTVTGNVSSGGVAAFTGPGASSFGGAVTFGGGGTFAGPASFSGAGTFGGGLTANGALVLTGTAGNVTAPGTGTNDFSAGRTLVKTLPYGTPNSTDAVSVEMLNQATFQSALPAQSVPGPRYLRTLNGVASWEPVNELPLLSLGII